MNTSRIVETSNLSAHDIERLVKDEISVLIVKDFYPKDYAKHLAHKIIESEERQHYTHEIVDDKTIKQIYFGVDRVGVPFNLIYDKTPDNPLVAQYYAEAPINIARMREYTFPAITPIDKLRLELDEKYKMGAMIAAYQNKKMLAGIGRVSHANLSHLSEDPPHFDALPEKFAQLSAQFAANVYLKVPESGGELELWDVPELTPLAIAPDNWRAVLPPSIVIKPEQGALIIFNCRRPHAIRRFSGMPRVTMQTFIGYLPNNPLLIWN